MIGRKIFATAYAATSHAFIFAPSVAVHVTTSPAASPTDSRADTVAANPCGCPDFPTPAGTAPISRSVIRSTCRQ